MNERMAHEEVVREVRARVPAASLRALSEGDQLRETVTGSSEVLNLCTNPHHGRANPKHYANGLCQACWKRLRDRGTLEPAQGLHEVCSIEDCDRPFVAKGYCKPHWRAWRKYGDPLRLRPWGRKRCSFPGCDDPHRALGLCIRHHGMRRRIIEATVRFPTLPRLPAGPLAHYVQMLREDGTTLDALGQQLGCDRRSLYRILDPEATLRDADADRYATALGLHPAMFWPDKWVLV